MVLLVRWTMRTELQDDLRVPSWQRVPGGSGRQQCVRMELCWSGECRVPWNSDLPMVRQRGGRQLAGLPNVRLAKLGPNQRQRAVVSQRIHQWLLRTQR